MKVNILHFTSEAHYLDWESKVGNCIYALQDTQGRYIGDIKEKDLIPLWDSNRIISFDNPKNKEEELLIEGITEKSCNWSITNDNDKDIFNKLVQIKYPKEKNNESN